MQALQTRLTRQDYTVGWVCALPIELAAAQEMLDEEHQSLPQDANDSNIYTLGHMSGHNVVVTCLPAGQIGNNSAASVVAQMRSTFNAIRFGLLVGIGGGVPSTEHDIRLGDVVISQPFGEHGGVVQYDFGKTTQDGFMRTGFLNASPTILLNAVTNLRSSQIRGRSSLMSHLAKLTSLSDFKSDTIGPDILFEATYKHVGGAQCDQCETDKVVNRPPRRTRDVVVHYGTIASGNQVMRDATIRDRVSLNLGGVLCFEMEAAGLMNSFPCLVVRGICDYADSHKNKNWQAYAAGTAAACAKEVLSMIPTAEVAMMRILDEIVTDANASFQASWTVPFQKNTRFVGRSIEISQINAILLRESRCERVAIFGLGGVGKTQIVLEYAHQLRKREPDCSVFWIQATSVEKMQEAYLEIACQLRLPNIEQEQAGIQERVQRYLSKESSGKWLLVFDNADEIDMWMNKVDSTSSSLRRIDYLPVSKYGSIIFTTRSRKAAVKLAGINVVLVGEMDNTIAKELFKNSLINQDLLNDNQATTDLLGKLTHLPLALVQAAAYINENKISLSEYAALLEGTEQNIIDILKEDFEDEGRYSDIRNPIATTWLVSFEQIQRRDPLAVEYLSFMSCIDAKDIPQSLLPSAPSTKKAIDAIGTLSAYSFVTKHQASELLDLHRLVHLATRNWLQTKSSLGQWGVKALRRLTEVFRNADYIDRSMWKTYIPHARYVLESHFDTDIEFEKTALLEEYGTYLYSDGKYNESEKAILQVMESRKRVLGVEHPDTLSSIHHLTMTYISQGRYKAAEELGMQLIETSKRVLGGEHPGTLSSIHNLATTYWYRGQLEKAEKLVLQVTETRKRVLSIEHPDALSSMHVLTLIYIDQGRWEEAEELGLQVMKTRKKILGIEHPDTLPSIHSLAYIYIYQGRYEEAEQLGIQLVETNKKVLGMMHPDTLNSTHILVSAFWSRGRWEEAEKLEVQVFENCKSLLGTEHPKTLSTMHNLLLTYLYQGRREEAEELGVQVVETRKRVLDVEHPDTLSSMHDLAFTRKDQNRNEEAVALMKGCVQLRERILGVDHHLTSKSREALERWESNIHS